MKVNPGNRYRLLKPGEIIRDTDEYLYGGKGDSWRKFSSPTHYLIGTEWHPEATDLVGGCVPVRRIKDDTLYRLLESGDVILETDEWLDRGEWNVIGSSARVVGKHWRHDGHAPFRRRITTDISSMKIEPININAKWSLA